MDRGPWRRPRMLSKLDSAVSRSGLAEASPWKCSRWPTHWPWPLRRRSPVRVLSCSCGLSPRGCRAGSCPAGAEGQPRGYGQRLQPRAAVAAPAPRLPQQLQLQGLRGQPQLALQVHRVPGRAQAGQQRGRPARVAVVHHGAQTLPARQQVQHHGRGCAAFAAQLNAGAVQARAQRPFQPRGQGRAVAAAGASGEGQGGRAVPQRAARLQQQYLALCGGIHAACQPGGGCPDDGGGHQAAQGACQRPPAR